MNAETRYKILVVVKKLASSTREYNIELGEKDNKNWNQHWGTEGDVGRRTGEGEINTLIVQQKVH